ncbi:hypothetical protein MMC22_010642 [Lobaria immixta]|nr:hypothetical protein [Lobaria immixta]
MADSNAYLESRTITRDVRFMLQRHHGEDWKTTGPTLTPLGRQYPTSAGNAPSPSAVSSAPLPPAPGSALTSPAPDRALTFLAPGSAPTPPVAGAADIYPLDCKYTAREKAKDNGIQTALHNLTLADKDGLTNKEIEAIPDIPDECFICYSQFNYRQNLSHYLVFCCQHWICQSCVDKVVRSTGPVCGHCRAPLPQKVYGGISREDAQARLIAEASAEAAGVGVWGQQQTQQAVQAVTPSPARQLATIPVVQLSQSAMREARVNAAHRREHEPISTPRISAARIEAVGWDDSEPTDR